jgi:DNA-3-methyladenine glycosylase
MDKIFNQNAETTAKNLLGKVLVRKINNKKLRAKIAETEAYYGKKDPASRACQNGDLRKTMMMKPGTILVYGVHNNWLLNFVNNSQGTAEAVLIRALEPLNFDGNCKGPGLLTKAMHIDKRFHKQNIINNQEILLEPGEAGEIGKSFRIGVSKDLKKKLRFFIKGNKFVSR